jgi:mannose-1-phosphate guanylyltransferase
MKAVILAGGKGTRLRPLTYTRPKPMVPFMNKPVMEHIIEKLASQGFKEIIITTNIKTTEIEDYFGDGSKWGVDFKLVHEKEPLGTAGSVKNAVHHLDDTFVVIQGDIISDIDIHELYLKHKDNDCMVTMALMEVEDVSHFGIAETDNDGCIVRFKEKPNEQETFSNLANAGIYVLEPEVLDMIPLALYDFSRDLFPKMLHENKRICGCTIHNFWRDVGKPEDYLAATRHYLAKKNKICEGCTIEDTGVSESVIGKNCKIKGSKIKQSVIFDNTSIGEDTIVDNCIIGENCVIEGLVELHDTIIGDNVAIGRGAAVAPGSRIGPNVQIASGNQASGVILPENLGD